MVFTVLFSVLFCLVGFIMGWLGCERYTALMMQEVHEFDQLFEENPHPEIFDKDGNGLVDLDEFAMGMAKVAFFLVDLDEFAMGMAKVTFFFGSISMNLPWGWQRLLFWGGRSR